MRLSNKLKNILYLGSITLATCGLLGISTGLVNANSNNQANNKSNPIRTTEITQNSNNNTVGKAINNPNITSMRQDTISTHNKSSINSSTSTNNAKSSSSVAQNNKSTSLLKSVPNVKSNATPSNNPNTISNKASISNRNANTNTINILPKSNYNNSSNRSNVYKSNNISNSNPIIILKATSSIPWYVRDETHFANVHRTTPTKIWKKYYHPLSPRQRQCKEFVISRESNGRYDVWCYTANKYGRPYGRFQLLPRYLKMMNPRHPYSDVNQENTAIWYLNHFNHDMYKGNWYNAAKHEYLYHNW